MDTRIGGVALLAVALALVGCGLRAEVLPAQPEDTASASADASPRTDATQDPVRGAWTPLPNGPLSPRDRALAFWVADRLLVLGGSDAPPCPPNASCAAPLEPPLRDGAAYDPTSDTWTPIRNAPMPLDQARGVVADGRVYLLVKERDFLAYDPAHDGWWTLPSPPRATPSWRQLAADEGGVIAYVTSHEHDEDRLPQDVRYDLARGVWEPVERDPLGPGFDRTFVGTPHGLVLLQAPLVENPGADGEPSLWEAAVWDQGTWRGLPGSEILSGHRPWVWAGGRLVAGTTGTANGGGPAPGDYGRELPYGGMLDVENGRWEPLPRSGPARWQGDWASAHSEELVFTEGALLDVRGGTWTRVPEPPGPRRWGTTTAWAGDRLVLWGGGSFPNDREGVLHDDGWYWLPAG